MVQVVLKWFLRSTLSHNHIFEKILFI